MDYERLTPSYLETHVDRVIRLKDAIVARGNAVSTGRVVPDDDDLGIGTGRRLALAIMFLDISGFSSRPAEFATEQDMLLRMFNLFFTEMITIAEEYGGTVEKNTGDGLMAYFEDRAGDPPEGGAKRAVACALSMMEINSLLINPIIRASGLSDLQFRLGIDYGSVTIARVGAARRFGSAVAIGTTANVARKMLDIGGPGEILVGERAVSQLPPDWRLCWCQRSTDQTGWVYRISGRPYRFYWYTGRWVCPQLGR